MRKWVILIGLVLLILSTYLVDRLFLGSITGLHIKKVDTKDSLPNSIGHVENTNLITGKVVNIVENSSPKENNGNFKTSRSGQTTSVIKDDISVKDIKSEGEFSSSGTSAQLNVSVMVVG